MTERKRLLLETNRILAEAIRRKRAEAKPRARAAPPATSPPLADLTTGPTSPADWKPVRRLPS
jgi:hypothetical protein